MNRVNVYGHSSDRADGHVKQETPDYCEDCEDAETRILYTPKRYVQAGFKIMTSQEGSSSVRKKTSTRFTKPKRK